jgi:hypothetical protein
MPLLGRSYPSGLDVHLLWHVRHAKNLDRSAVQHRDSSGEVLIDDDFDDVKIVDIYSSEQAAAAAISRAQMRPGFAEEPDCFTIDICTMEEDSWTDGLVTIPVGSD